MSKEQIERERDDAEDLVARRREWYDQATAYIAAQGIPAIAFGIQWKKDLEETGAYLHIIDRLTAERNAARAELAKLREACVDVPWMLERAADLFAFEIADVGIDDNSEIRSWREQSQYLRAALEREADHE